MVARDCEPGSARDHAIEGREALVDIGIVIERDALILHPRVRFELALLFSHANPQYGFSALPT